jgi:hypothetical protein
MGRINEKGGNVFKETRFDGRLDNWNCQRLFEAEESK